MNINKQAIADAIHIRTWLMRLNRGETVSIHPMSPDHEQLQQVLNYIERYMKLFLVNANRKHKGTVDNPSKHTAYVRERRRKQSEQLQKLIRQYLAVHEETV